jgi:hypothetical protein
LALSARKITPAEHQLQSCRLTDLIVGRIFGPDESGLDQFEEQVEQLTEFPATLYNHHKAQHKAHSS